MGVGLIVVILDGELLGFHGQHHPRVPLLVEGPMHSNTIADLVWERRGGGGRRGRLANWRVGRNIPVLDSQHGVGERLHGVRGDAPLAFGAIVGHSVWDAISVCALGISLSSDANLLSSGANPLSFAG